VLEALLIVREVAVDQAVQAAALRKLVGIMAAAVAVAMLIFLAAARGEALLCVLFGPVPLDHSHQQTRGIYNGTLHSN
jgi:hypothetical protein